MVEDSKTLYFIAGVTASGKTEISLDWAEKIMLKLYPATRLLFIKVWILVRPSRLLVTKEE